MNAFTPNDFPDSTSDSAAIQATVDAAVANGIYKVTVPVWNDRTQAPV